ncbi:hypothetical protein [Pantoea sp. 1.19]|nr:hypothetical protein [Pantoea sp. 1.19]
MDTELNTWKAFIEAMLRPSPDEITTISSGIVAQERAETAAAQQAA